MKKELWLIIALAIIIIGLAGFLLWPKPVVNNNQKQEVLGIQVNSPKVNEEVSSPLEITGTTNGEGWNGFEGQVGVVRLLDSSGNELALGILTATTDWMNPPVSFKTDLTFDSPIDQAGTLVFKNENPSGLPDKDKDFTIPVKIIKTSSETMSVNVYFNNSNFDPEYSCNKVFPVQRNIPKTQAVARASLGELFLGPTDAEKNAGFSTSINSGVKIQSLTIVDGVAKVDFDEQLEYQVGGSCRVSAIRAQITETLKQFSTVDSVIISIDGRTEDILQP